MNELKIRAIIIKYLNVTGLPRKNFYLANRVQMVKWDAMTGEVSTVQYGHGSSIDFVSYDEIGRIKNAALERTPLR